MAGALRPAVPFISQTRQTRLNLVANPGELRSIIVSRAVDLWGGSEEIERSGILNNCGNNTFKYRKQLN
jgi:hypothetical protein